MKSTIAADSASIMPSVSTSGAAPSGCRAFSPGGDSRVTASRVCFTIS